MKKVFAAGAAAAVTMLCASQASAQTADSEHGYYANAGYTRFAGDDDADANLDGLTGRAGVRQGFIGVEVEGSIGIGSESQRVEGVNVDVSLTHTYAGYVVAYKRISENVDVFARAGLGEIKLEAKALGEMEEVSEGLFAFGVGGQYFFGGGVNGIRADFTRIELGEEDEDDEDLNGSVNSVSLSFVRRF
jgi:hypothetical protein